MTDRQTRPLVSIISIFLNAEKFFHEAIKSVFDQTYDHWELLLIDDGSHDGSTTIAQHVAARYPEKVRYLEHAGHRNVGKSTSRNVGIQQARGEYITFLDADDVLLPDKLARQVAILASHPEAGMVYGRTLYWHSWTGNPTDRWRDVLGNLGVRAERLFQPPTLLTRFLRHSGTVPCLCGLLTRRRIVIEVGGFDETIQHLYEDQAFLAKVCLATPVYVESGCGERYRQHPDSSSAAARRTGEYNPLWPNPARDAFVSWLTQYISAQGIQDAALERALRKASRPFRYPNIYRLIKPVCYPVYRLGLHMRSYANVLKRRLFPRSYTYDQHILPPWFSRWLGALCSGGPPRPPAGSIDFGALRRVHPISRAFGYDRGQPIDRYYIENFLARYAHDIRGRVLEVGDASYTHRFGKQHVTTSDVLHVTADHPTATIVGDLTRAHHIPSHTFDCFLLTQTLHLIYEVPQALQTIYRILKPHGVVLATVPGISQISHDQWAQDWYWSFTTRAVQRLFEEVFPPANVTVESWGNVLAAAAFLQGLCVAELRPAELEYRDANYQLLITVRAEKPER